MLRTTHLHPILELEPYLKNIWIIENTSNNHSSKQKMIPFGCMDLVFVENTSLYLINDDGITTKLSNIFISGQITKPYHLVYDPGIRVIGLGFYPHTAHYFTKINSKLLTDQIIDVDSFLSTRNKIYLNQSQVASKNDIDKMVYQIQKNVFQIIKQSKSIGKQAVYTQEIVKSILKNKGNFNISSIAKSLCVSERYVQILLNEYVGLNPTQYGRIIKFLNSIKLIKESNRTLTSISYDLGYYDQSHFVRDFKKFTGQSPTSYRLKENTLIENFTSSEWTSFLYNDLAQ